MAAEKAAQLRETILSDLVDSPLLVPPPARIDNARRHVINRAMQEKSGRLYCNEDWDLDIPGHQFYSTR